ncbi:RNA polymerase sigma factor [Actinokineospora pegani]|uniref:RNA polymerase sigma factor n=1 Tax=Actinokineospora pegani TaxID=2654637 RepID=UPI0012EA5D8B|nr:RNA polymerase sigma factor [Actinokineospora pegani]
MRQGTVGDDERALLRRTARGDRAAFAEFYRRTSPWLAVRLRRRCADHELVDEVVQETYVVVWRAAGSIAETSAVDSALGWLWTIANRRLVDAFRREGRQRAVAERAVAVPGAEQAVVDSSLSGDVGSALNALAPELRAVLRALVLDGLSVRETSALLGIPEGTVKTRARRARLMMREAMS